MQNSIWIAVFLLIILPMLERRRRRRRNAIIKHVLYNKKRNKENNKMKELTTADRLKQIMSERGLKQVDILEACKPYCERYGVQLKKNDLSQYVSGKVEPKQDKLSILGMALNVNEVWLMGYNVPAGRKELEKLEQQLQSEVTACELFEKCYGKEAFEAVKLFVQLDTLDQGKVIGKMELMLEDEKYSAKEGSSSEQAM